jgi:hypothetical protein
MRYPLNRKMVSQKSPGEVYAELINAAAANSIPWRRHDDSAAYCIQATGAYVSLEAEVVKLPGLSLHGIHFKRLRGETSAYTELCNLLLESMRL